MKKHPQKKKMNILLCHKNDSIKNSLSQAINSYSEEFITIKTANNFKQVIDQLNNTSIDVLIIRFDREEENPFNLIPILKEKYPTTTLIVMSFLGESLYIKKLLTSGVHHFYQIGTNVKVLLVKINIS